MSASELMALSKEQWVLIASAVQSMRGRAGLKPDTYRAIDSLAAQLASACPLCGGEHRVDKCETLTADEQHAAKVRAALRAREAAADCWMRLAWWARIDAMDDFARSDFLAGFGADWTPPSRPTDTELAELRAWMRAYVDRLIARREWAQGKRVLFIERHVGLALGGSDWDATGRAALAFAGVDLNAEVKP